MEIRAEDFKVEYIAPRPPGGQHVGLNWPKVKVTHIPTGISYTEDNSTSDFRNRQRAMRMLFRELEGMGYTIPEPIDLAYNYSKFFGKNGKSKKIS